MWIGAIRLRIKTKNAPDAGTDDSLQVSILRDGKVLRTLDLDYPDENDFEQGADRNYDYIGPTRLPRRNDKTPVLPPGIGKNPMPYPSYGFEFSKGMNGHLTLLLSIGGDNQWLEDSIDLYVQEIRLKQTSFDTLAWIQDADWHFIASWKSDMRMSTTPSEGSATIGFFLP